MDEGDELTNRYYDRHVDPTYSGPDGSGCLTSSDVLGLFWPILLVLLALPIGATIVAVLDGATTAWGYALGLAVYGGLLAALLTIPWCAAYLFARAVSIWIGSRAVLWAGVAGIIATAIFIATGAREWASLLAVSSLSAMVSAAVRIRAER